MVIHRGRQLHFLKVPIVDGVFVPRSPLTPAETHVDWAATDAHVVGQRVRVERDALPAARRLAVLAVQQHGFASPAVIRALAGRLETGLARTAHFGYASVDRELASLRSDHAALAGLAIPDAGRYATIAAKGLAAVLALVKQRADVAARAVSSSVHQAIQDAGALPGGALDVALAMAIRTVHLQVLELVGETLNLGRTAGALHHTKPPEFAMRSEQLDRNTCVPCDELHGTVAIVGSPEYYAVLPPLGCLGGGRCRGVMVFGDGPRDVRAPALAA